MADGYDIDVNVTGNAEEKLDDISQSAGKTAKATEDVDKANKKAEKSTTSFTDKVAKLAVVYGVLKTTLVDSVKLYGEQQAATGRLKRSLDAVNASLSERTKIDHVLRKNRDDFGSDIQEQQDALGRLVQTTGNVEMAMRDLALAQDIAAQEGVSLAEASDSIRRARIGEVEELKKYIGFTKNSVEQLGKLEDGALKGEIAVAKLGAAYSGAAAENAGLNEEMESFDKQLEEVKASAGEATVALASLLGRLAEIATGSEDNEFGVTNMTRAFSNFGQAIADSASELELLIDRQALLTALPAIMSGNPASMLAVVQGAQNRANERQNQRARDRANGGVGGSGGQGGDGFVFGMEDAGIIIGDDAQKKKSGGGSSARKEEDGFVFDLADVQELERINEIEQKRVEIAREFDETRARVLRHELRILEIKNQQLGAGEQEAAVAEATRQFLNESKEAQEETAAAIERKSQAIQRANEAREAEAAAKAQRDAAEAVRTENEAIQQRNASIRAGAQGFTQVAALAGASERQIAGLRGAMEAAEAIAAGATGNVPGAIAHGVAAAKFFAIAGGAGGNTGTAAPSGGSSRARQTSDDAAARQSAQGVGRERGNTTVQMVFNAAFPPSPNNARQLVNAVDQEMRNRSAPNGVR